MATYIAGTNKNNATDEFGYLKHTLALTSHSNYRYFLMKGGIVLCIFLYII